MSTSRNTLDLWRMDDSSYAPEDTTLGHMFGIVAALDWIGETIPHEVGYRAGAMGPSDPEDSWPDSEYADRLDDGSLTPDEARRALLLLHRYLRLVRTLHPGHFS